MECTCCIVREQDEQAMGGTLGWGASTEVPEV